MPRLMRYALVALVAVAALATAVSAVRSYRSFDLLRSAYGLGVPETGSIRAWMSLRYVAETYRTPAAALLERLGLPPETDPDTSLRQLAELEGQSPFEYARRVQRAVAGAAPRAAAGQTGEAGWLGSLGDQVLAGLLVHGYSILGLTLLLGAVGLPLPTGLATVVAGSLVARGAMSWSGAGTVAVTASVLGDLAGYGLGRLLNEKFLQRHGRWLGYTPARAQRVERFFRRWGGVGVLLSRTLASHLSSVLSLLAGTGRYRLDAFAAFTVAGRIVWTLAYLGLGYAAGSDLEAAAGFLANVSVFLISSAVLVASALAAFSVRAPSSSPRR